MITLRLTEQEYYLLVEVLEDVSRYREDRTGATKLPWFKFTVPDEFNMQTLKYK